MPTKAKSVRVVVADDSLVAREMLSQILSSDPEIEVVGQAHDGVEAVEMVTRLKPDLVTMDITMPEVDGLECVSNMVRIAPDVRILVISALADEETAIEAVERGANGYVCKPFTAVELNAAFEELRGGL